MNNRLQQFLAAENISQSQLAETLDVARASISHIISGRNKPGFDFIESMARHYPTLSLEWLIVGKGRMYKTPLTPEPEQAPVPAATADPAPIQAEIHQRSLFDDNDEAADMETPGLDTASAPISDFPAATSREARRIDKMIVFYSDGTFQEVR